MPKNILLNLTNVIQVWTRRTSTEKKLFLSYQNFNSLFNLIKIILNLISMLLKLIRIDDDDDDIKTLNHSQRIVSVHIDHLKETIREKKKYERIFSLFEPLKSKSRWNEWISMEKLFFSFEDFVQHYQMKVELTEENIFTLLVLCLFKVKLIVLEILFSISFRIDTFRILKREE